jgi:hypothetical protein|tara:strand:+ start:3109 stop:3729 length:621 start_codon:yes stop_codon:yes gene_type:complete
MNDFKYSIHTIGDSHAFKASCVEGVKPQVIQHHLGPVLCYSFGVEKLNRCDIRKLNINNGDSIIFCLGEIDCRCHIHKHLNHETTYRTVIDRIVDNYFEAIKLNIQVSKIKLKNVCVYNVVPPIQKHNTKEDPSFPYLGTDEERKNYVLYFNKKLKENCNKNNFIFFNVYDKYTDENGFLRKDMSDGICHLKNKIHVKNFIIKNQI